MGALRSQYNHQCCLAMESTGILTGLFVSAPHALLGECTVDVCAKLFHTCNMGC